MRIEENGHDTIKILWQRYSQFAKSIICYNMGNSAAYCQNCIHMDSRVSRGVLLISAMIDLSERTD